jgi:uncharacterized protein
MSIETIKEVVTWLKDFRNDQVTFTFHGGEPLLAGADFYREALPLLAEGAGHLQPAFALQTNLWKMTPELARILAAYDIPIGSSLDGPKELNDRQRGIGYFDKTMHGYEIARENGLDVRFICTFTAQSVKFKEDIFNFFLENGLTLKLHPALPSLRGGSSDEWVLDSREYGELLIFLLDKYLENMDKIEVMNIDHLCKCVFTRRGTVCTYVDCMDSTFAVGPDGSIYPCYRFVGMPEYVMGSVYDHPAMEDLARGSVYDHPAMEDLARSDAWARMHRFKDYVDQECKECPHISYCRGGCPYNAMVPSNGEIEGVDPHCTAYKMIFEEITDRINQNFMGAPSMAMNPFQSEPAKIMPLIFRTMSR